MIANTGNSEKCEGDVKQLSTRLGCARGHVAEHRGGVTLADLEAMCWCWAPRTAATVYRLSAPALHHSAAQNGERRNAGQQTERHHETRLGHRRRGSCCRRADVIDAHERTRTGRCCQTRAAGRDGGVGGCGRRRKRGRRCGPALLWNCNWRAEAVVVV